MSFLEEPPHVLKVHTPPDESPEPPRCGPAKSVSAPASELPPLSPERSTGERAKARDIIAAIRTVKAIEDEKRPATAEEKRILSRFQGFGGVALSIFPDPRTGKFKPGWEQIGEELKSLLTMTKGWEVCHSDCR